MSDAARWSRVQDVFLDALEQPETARDFFLRGACKGDPDLEAEVRSLLAAHVAEDLIPALDQAPGNPRLFGLPQDHVGPYRIIRPLGQGGMGMVYLATREEYDVTQTVALKLLRMDFATPELLARFRAERQILARLEHPGIARLIAAGATESGQPYFAMEFVEGTSLLDYCRRHECPLSERLRLFLEVCEAVEYAHQQLVVHRDLKPGNILVSEEGRPKLLDFGIAKLLDAEGPATGATHTSGWLTPDYASPEQLRGQPVSTLGDVYALGVVLYELLAGTRPYDLRGLSPAAVELRVGTGPPERPSNRVADPRMAKLLRGDLDTIILKALSPEPARRYADARELADDLRRYLARRPVRARPDHWSYHASRFVQRHRAEVTAAAVVVVSLIGALGAVGWQAAVASKERDRAEQALGESRDVSNFLLGFFQAADPTRMPRDTGAARAILRQGVAEMEALGGQPLLQAGMLDALGMIYLNLGEHDRAYQFVTRGLALRRERLDPAHPDLAESLRHTGRVLRALARYGEAERTYVEAREVLRRGHAERSPAMAELLGELGFLMPYLGRPEDAVAYYGDALALQRELHGDRHPAVASSVLSYGLALRRRGLYREADSVIRDAVARYRRDIGPNDVRTAEALFHLADVVAERGGDTLEVEALYREGIAINRAHDGPGSLGSVHGLESLAEVRSARGDHREAEALLRESLAIHMAVFGPGSPSVAGSVDLLAMELGRQGRFAEALPMKRQGLAMWRQAVGGEHGATAGSMSALAELLMAHREYREADSLLADVLALRARLHGATSPGVGIAHSLIGELRRQQHRYADAEVELLQALDILGLHEQDRHYDIRMTCLRLAEVYQALGREEEAARYRARAKG